MPGRQLYSPSLKDVAWLPDAQLIFLFFLTFVCKFEWVDAARGKTTATTTTTTLTMTTITTKNNRRQCTGN